MSAVLFYMAMIACLATLGVLTVGIVGFGARHREGIKGARFSNRLMRWRIIAQFIAIVLIMATVLVIRGGG
jgi:hypothetical protein